MTLAVRCSQPEPGLDKDADSVTGLSDESLKFLVIYKLGLILEKLSLYHWNVKSKRVSLLPAIVNLLETIKREASLSPRVDDSISHQCALPFVHTIALWRIILSRGLKHPVILWRSFVLRQGCLRV